MRFSDIQWSDKELWQRFQALWKTDVDAALTLLNTAQLAKKGQIAKGLNDLTNYVVQVEELNDPTYASDRIQVSTTPPADLQNGEVYFEWTNPVP